MIKYAAFLRGIGPGNPNMRNDKLRGVFESLGLHNVQTIISSGNVIFESDITDPATLEKMIEAEWPIQLGFSSTTIIRSLAQLEELAALNPFKDLTHTSKTNLTVTFLKNSPDAMPDFPYQPEGKAYRLIGSHDNAVFSIVDLTGAKTPDLMAWLEKRFGREITTRTWNTVNRVISKLK